MPGSLTTPGTPAAPARLATTTAAGALVFLTLLVDAAVVGFGARADAGAEAWLAARRSDGLATLGNLIATPGDTLIVLMLLAAGVLACLAMRCWWHATLLGGSGMLGLAVVASVKALVDRARPIVDHDLSASFPSGHAAKSVIAYALVLVVVADAWRRTRGASGSGIGGTLREVRAGLLGVSVLALVVGMGRLVEGVHWVTDVLAGWAFGAAWVAASFLALTTLPRVLDPSRPRVRGKGS